MYGVLKTISAHARYVEGTIFFVKNNNNKETKKMVKKVTPQKKKNQKRDKKSNIISTSVEFVPKRDEGDGEVGESLGMGKGKGKGGVFVAGFNDQISFKSGKGF